MADEETNGDDAQVNDDITQDDTSDDTTADDDIDAGGTDDLEVGGEV